MLVRAIKGGMRNGGKGKEGGEGSWVPMLAFGILACWRVGRVWDVGDLAEK